MPEEDPEEPPTQRNPLWYDAQYPAYHNRTNHYVQQTNPPDHGPTEEVGQTIPEESANLNNPERTPTVIAIEGNDSWGRLSHLERDT